MILPSPGDGSTRSGTRSIAETSWSGSGEDVRRNGGAAGIDRITIADVQEVTQPR